MMRDTTGGLRFENKSNLRKSLICTRGFEVRGDYVYKEGSDIKLSILVEKSKLIKYLKSLGIDYLKYVRKKKLPDSAIIHLDKNGNPTMLTIYENRSQKTPGSADEKIGAAPYNRKYYLKLVRALGIKVDYVFIFNDWFKNGYEDELEYLREENIQYYFNEIPVDKVFPHFHV
jgi:hypothetical protein